MTRDMDGSLHVVENVCAHRGMQFCRERHGNKKELVCPYHQWNYSLKGDLQGVPFRRGVKQDGKVNGGMPKEFKTEDHGLNKLKVATRGGVVFASFDHEVESFEDYLGPTILAYFDRLFNGRKLTILGYNRQRIPGNWKLMQENIKDPYHPGLLHTWFVTYGLWRADNKSELKMDDQFRHAAMISTRGTCGAKEDVTQGVTSFKENMEIQDKRLIDIVPEAWWNGPTAVMMTIFPSVIFQQQVNSVSTRHIQPNGHGSFDFVWTHFGFEDDTDEMTQRRLIQANLFGPAGFVSADDGEVIELSQFGFEQKPSHRAVAELGGDTKRINTLAPAELVIDHSVIADLFGTADAFEKNTDIEYERNQERYRFLRWGQTAFDEFTRCQFCPDNYRGVGFDKPFVQYIPGKSSIAKDASPESYGHSGYTGTFVWIDPKEELIYIFLSNRVYPTRESRAIYDLNIRPRIQQSIYNALKN
jgi:salicylate 5-hydroxylase large subunit